MDHPLRNTSRPARWPVSPRGARRAAEGVIDTLLARAGDLPAAFTTTGAHLHGTTAPSLLIDLARSEAARHGGGPSAAPPALRAVQR